MTAQKSPKKSQIFGEILGIFQGVSRGFSKICHGTAMPSIPKALSISSGVAACVSIAKMPGTCSPGLEIISAFFVSNSCGERARDMSTP